MSPTCPYCKAKSELVTGDKVYLHRPDLATVYFYQCKPCDAHVGVHVGTKTSLGRLANSELRSKRVDVHRLLDPYWQSGLMSRQAAYHRLAGLMGTSKKACHIGLFDTEACDKAIEVLKENMYDT